MRSENKVEGQGQTVGAVETTEQTGAGRVSLGEYFFGGGKNLIGEFLFQARQEPAESYLPSFKGLMEFVKDERLKFEDRAAFFVDAVRTMSRTEWDEVAKSGEMRRQAEEAVKLAHQILNGRGEFKDADRLTIAAAINDGKLDLEGKLPSDRVKLLTPFISNRDESNGFRVGIVDLYTVEGKLNFSYLDPNRVLDAVAKIVADPSESWSSLRKPLLSKMEGKITSNDYLDNHPAAQLALAEIIHKGELPMRNRLALMDLFGDAMSSEAQQRFLRVAETHREKELIRDTALGALARLGDKLDPALKDRFEIASNYKADVI